MIRAVFTYSLLSVAFILVSVTFVTARNYTQLSIAIVIYSLFALFTYKAFPHFWSNYSKKKDIPLLPQGKDEITAGIKVEETKITDVDKRAFLKLIGATGLSFFLISIFGRRFETLLFGQNLVQAPGENPASGKTTPASPTDGYSISGIDYDSDGYFGYINEDGSWYIMKGDPSTRSFLYVKGGSKFPENWENRENLKYDYYNNVF